MALPTLTFPAGVNISPGGEKLNLQPGANYGRSFAPILIAQLRR